MGKGTLVSIFLISIVCLASTASAGPSFQSVCFELHKDGDFFHKTIDEGLGTKEGRVLIAAVCTAITRDPQSCAEGVEAARLVYTSVRRRGGSDYTGEIQVAGDREICRAFFITDDFSATSDTDSSMTLRSNGNGPRAELGWYAAIGGGGSRGRWVRYQVVLEVIPRGEGNEKCFKNDQLLWETHDRTWGNTVGAAEKQLPRCQRWCTGRLSKKWLTDCRTQ